MLTADYVFWPAVVLIVLSSLYYGPRIKADRVAMQWGFDGKPTWHAPKLMALWGMVVFAVALRLLIWAAMTFIPDRVHGPEIGLLVISIVLPAVHLWTLRAAARAS